MTPRETVIAYLFMKAQEADWHAVADAACDLREMEAEERGRLAPRQELPGMPWYMPSETEKGNR